MDTNPFRPPTAVVQDMKQHYSGALLEQDVIVPASTAIDWVKQGSKIVFANLGKWMLLLFIFTVLYMLLNFIPLLNMTAIFVIPMFMGGLMLIYQKADQGEDFEYSDLFAGFASEKIGSMLLIGLFYMLFWFLIMIPIVFVGVGGSLAFPSLMDDYKSILPLLIILAIIPLVIVFLPLTFAYMIAPAFVMFYDMKAWPAYKRSIIAVARNRRACALYILLGIPISLAGVLCLGVGVLASSAILYFGLYAMYRDFFTESKPLAGSVLLDKK